MSDPDQSHHTHPVPSHANPITRAHLILAWPTRNPLAPSHPTPTPISHQVCHQARRSWSFAGRCARVLAARTRRLPSVHPRPPYRCRAQSHRQTALRHARGAGLILGWDRGRVGWDLGGISVGSRCDFGGIGVGFRWDRGGISVGSGWDRWVVGTGWGMRRRMR